MKCARRLIFVILLVVGASSGIVTAPAPVHIVIAHTNDIHGQLQPRNGIGGLAEVATVIRSLHPDLILDAGDMFTGTFINDEFKGLPMIQAMNKIGYTSGTIGNHEFDYGLRVLRTRLRDAKFPVLSADVRIPISEIKKYKVVTVKGIRFGIIGITTEETITTTHPKNLQGVRILDAIQSIGRVLPEVRNKADFIIITAHLNEEEEKRVANAFPEIRLIIGGHVHTALGPIWVGQTLIAKTGNIGRFVGRVDLQFEGKTLTDIKGQLVPVKNVDAAPDIARIIGSYASKVTKKMSEVIGEATDDLPTSNNSESPLGNLIADVYREKGKTQIGLQNTGGIRTRIFKGPITWGAVFEVLPFQNTLVTLKLTGAQLKQTLNVGLLAVSGLRVHLDLKKPVGQRLVSVTMPDGAPIDDAAFYSITTNDFVMAGGDGFSEVGKGIDIKDTGILLRDVLVDYIKAHVTVSPALDGRVTVN